MKITDLMSKEAIKIHGHASNKMDAIDQMVSLMYRQGNVSDKEVYKEAVIERQYPIHKEVLDACKSRKKDDICRALSDHYMRTIRRLLKEQGKTEKDTKFSLDFLVS